MSGHFFCTLHIVLQEWSQRSPSVVLVKKLTYFRQFNEIKAVARKFTGLLPSWLYGQSCWILLRRRWRKRANNLLKRHDWCTWEVDFCTMEIESKVSRKTLTLWPETQLFFFLLKSPSLSSNIRVQYSCSAWLGWKLLWAIWLKKRWRERKSKNLFTKLPQWQLVNDEYFEVGRVVYISKSLISPDKLFVAEILYWQPSSWSSKCVQIRL